MFIYLGLLILFTFLGVHLQYFGLKPEMW